MAFVQNSLLPSFASSNNTTGVSINKRRRFAPHSIPIIQPIDNSDILDHTFDSPLLLQLCEQSPSQQEIEAQLLQVGMRVRKSIADGYRTRAFTPRPFFNAHQLSPGLQAALSNTNDQFSAGGLHNVGNMSMQPVSTATFCGINLAALAHISDDKTSPVEEQKLWTYTTSHKRSMGEDESDSDDSQEFSMPQTPTENILVDYFSIDMDDMTEVSTIPQVRDIRTADLLGRKLAKPKSRVRSTPQDRPQMAQWNPWAGITAEQNEWEPQDSTTSFEMQASLDNNDFGEASFLQRREDIDMDCS